MRESTRDLCRLVMFEKWAEIVITHSDLVSSAIVCVDRV